MKSIFPGSDDDDFTPEMAQAAVDRYFDIGPERERQLQAVIKQGRDGDYHVPYASMGYGSDFSDHANYQVFMEKYPWLTYCKLNPDAYEQAVRYGDEGAVTWHEFLTGIPPEQWDEFLEDLKEVQNDPDGFAGDLVWELESKEVDRYWAEDAHWDVLNDICAKLTNSFHQFVVRQMTVEDTWEIARKLEIYPESQGEASVWVKTEDIAEQFDFDDWALTHDIQQHADAWHNEKRRAWSKDHRAIFEKALTHAVAGDEQAQTLLHGASDADLFRLLLRVVPDDFGSIRAPRWIFHGYHTEEKNRWFVGGEEVKSVDNPHVAVEFGLAVAAQQAAAQMTGTRWPLPPPEDHPEFQFEAKSGDTFDAEEDWDAQKAEDWILSGGHDSGKQIYRDEFVRVLIPYTLFTLQKYVPKAEPLLNHSAQQRTNRQEMDALQRDGEIMVVVPMNQQTPVQYGTGGPFALAVRSEGLMAAWSGVSVTNRLDSYPTLRKGLLLWFRKKARSDLEKYFPVLLQLGGFKAVQRYLPRIREEADDALKFKIGLAAAQAGVLDTAAELLKHDATLLTKEGFYAVYDDWSDMTFLFERNNRGTAEKVFSGDMDWLRDYAGDASFDISSLTSDLTPAHFDIIRGTLLWREVPDEEGNLVPLTRAGVDALSNEDIAAFLDDEELDDFEAYRDALRHAASDALESSLESAWVTGYEGAVTDLLGPSSWKTYRGKDRLAFFIKWDRAQEMMDETDAFEGSLAELLEDYAGEASVRDEYDASYDDSEGYLTQLLSDQLGEIEPADYPEDPNQIQLDIGDPRGYRTQYFLYSPAHPEGANHALTSAEYQQTRRNQPWRFNKEAFDAYMVQQAAQPEGGAPPAPGLGESVDFFWASVYDSDSGDRLDFDASPYFKVAPVPVIRSLEGAGWKHFRADDVAWEAAKKNKTLANFLDVASGGWVVVIDPVLARKAFNQRLGDEGMRLIPSSELNDSLKEFIEWPAVRIDGQHVFTGFVHGSAFNKAVAQGLITDEEGLGPRHEEGFVTNLGRWMEREEAFDFAKAHHQAKDPDADYFDAEDLIVPESLRAESAELDDIDPERYLDAVRFVVRLEHIEYPNSEYFPTVWLNMAGVLRSQEVFMTHPEALAAVAAYKSRNRRPYYNWHIEPASCDEHGNALHGRDVWESVDSDIVYKPVVLSESLQEGVSDEMWRELYEIMPVISPYWHAAKDEKGRFSHDEFRKLVNGDKAFQDRHHVWITTGNKQTGYNNKRDYVLLSATNTRTLYTIKTTLAHELVHRYQTRSLVRVGGSLDKKDAGYARMLAKGVVHARHPWESEAISAETIAGSALPKSDALDKLRKPSGGYMTPRTKRGKRWSRYMYRHVQAMPESLDEGNAYKYGCALVALPEGHASFVIQWGQANIPDDLIWNEGDEGGRETDVHTTAKYGFVGDPLAELRDIGQNTAPFPVYIGTVSLFQQADHDVVKLDVESPWLHQLNDELSRLPNEDKYPTYKPHITVAYVKKGSCDHLVGADLFAPEGSPSAEFMATSMDYQGATEDSDDPDRVVDHILFSKPKLDEAMPNVDALFHQLAERLKVVFDQCLPDVGKCIKTAAEDPVLSNYVRLTAGSPYNPTKGQYHGTDKRVVIGIYDGMKPSNWRATLKHELVHRAQHERSKWATKGGYGAKTRRIKAAMQRAAVQNHELEQKHPVPLTPEEFARQRLARASYDSSADKLLPAYYDEPSEAQAHAVEVATELHGDPQWKERLRAGAKDTEKGSAYAKYANASGRKRMLKNAYQAMTQESKPKLAEAKEQIKACAIRMKDGRVITGRMHHDCLDRAVALGLIGELPKDELPYEVYDIEPGFVTNTNRFLNREEAYQLAASTGLVPDEGELGQLHGSDVWESVDSDDIDPQRYIDALPDSMENVLRWAGFVQTMPTRWAREYHVLGKMRYAAVFYRNDIRDWGMVAYDARPGSGQVSKAFEVRGEGPVREALARLVPVQESADPDDIDLQRYIDTTKIPVYYELYLDMPQIGMRLWFNTAGSPSSKPERLIYSEALELQKHLQPSYAIPVQLKPAEDQSQMYWQGVRWPEDFYLKDGMWHNKPVVKESAGADPDDIDLPRYIDTTIDTHNLVIAADSRNGQKVYWRVTGVRGGRQSWVPQAQRATRYDSHAPAAAEMNRLEKVLLTCPVETRGVDHVRLELVQESADYDPDDPQRYIDAEARVLYLVKSPVAKTYFDGIGWQHSLSRAKQYSRGEAEVERQRLLANRARLGSWAAADPNWCVVVLAQPEYDLWRDSIGEAEDSDKRFVVYKGGAPASATVSLPAAVRLLRQAVKEGAEVRLQAHQPFDCLPFPIEPGQLNRFLRGGSRRPQRVIL